MNSPSKKIIIDASGRTLGRVATEAARYLRGKHLTTFAPHKKSDVTVEIINVGSMKLTGRKIDQKELVHHSEYPGGLKRVPVSRIWEGNPAVVLRHAVKGMLPRVKHREVLMKSLITKA